jgi:lipopolysaccharide/colanic/teichoic acid biosynthesis glycosyltransferase
MSKILNDRPNKSAFGLLAEEYFKEMLSMERKRTERSGRPFILLLLGVGEVYSKEGDIGKVSSLLSSSTRQTDIKGWYRHGSAVGVIFTSPRITDKNLLKDKIENELGDVLGQERAKRITITVHSFPEEGGQPDDNLYPDLRERDASTKISGFLKRMMDVMGSIFGLLIFSPLFLIFSVLIKLTSKGPILFRQERVGLFGEKIEFLKFRSMYINNDGSIHKEYIQNLIGGKVGQDGIFKIKEDPRITPVGKILRKTSLDELPQFLNVLKGDMSLVGPRPPIPYEVEGYDLWHRRRVLEVKPGITGLWQVKGRSSTSFDEMVRLDLKYVTEWSLWSDIKLLLQTPWAVLTARGAH